MYQLMIIDDEPIVRLGIRELLHWEDYEFEVCAEGVDGKDGLAKLLKFRPDLCLVDVKMPGMTGLELIREAKKAGYNGRFIILTGYSDFEFAKTAISLGVRAYLLKPIDEDELLENVQEVLSELHAQKNLDDYYSSSELKARQEVLHRILYSDDTSSLEHDIKTYGLDFTHACFCVSLIYGKEAFTFMDPVYSEKAEMMQHGLGNLEKIVLEDRLVLIHKGSSYKALMEKLMQNNEKVKKHFGESFTVVIGHDVAHWEDIHFSYECARFLAEYAFLYEKDMVISLDIFDYPQTQGGENFVDRLCGLIEIGDTETIGNVVDEYTAWLQTRLMKESELKILIGHHIISLQNMLEKRYNGHQESFPSFTEVTTAIKSAKALTSLMNSIREYCVRMSNVVGTSGMDNVAKRMYAYMERNYDKDLKLESIARIFNYNSAYLGKIFKKEIGESFNSVLDMIRIENAKRLLQETTLKVYQISKQIGYVNIDYFYAKFKKYVGISPKEYKQAYGKQS